ncbi:MerC domain-containing protein [Dyadobacter sp. LJ53]|uniref:MerC domain-containing protein n=1 Tax=Dyadobacter chenwenxiniae TaxID=2906456 RepID=UPI001F432F47|nr:MerC domain-containing protein [Dyadobacter chenwenxiniae]MCF0052914.1 MerC domain-containing protein [Dyadobacter chenwenxiniae]
MKAEHSHSKADYIGILGSVLCIVHCLLMPALAFGTTMTAHHDHAGLISLDYLFILINGVAVYFATKNHKSVAVRAILWGSLALFSVSLIFEAAHPAFVWLGYIGSALLIIGHLLNLYICQIAPKMKWKVS